MPDWIYFIRAVGVLVLFYFVSIGKTYKRKDEIEGHLLINLEFSRNLGWGVRHCLSQPNRCIIDIPLVINEWTFEIITTMRTVGQWTMGETEKRSYFKQVAITSRGNVDLFGIRIKFFHPPLSDSSEYKTKSLIKSTTFSRKVTHNTIRIYVENIYLFFIYNSFMDNSHYKFVNRV